MSEHTRPAIDGNPVSKIDDPVGAMPDTLALTGPVIVAGGEARTVVIVDRPGGGIEALVVEP